MMCKAIFFSFHGFFFSYPGSDFYESADTPAQIAEQEYSKF